MSCTSPSSKLIPMDYLWEVFSHKVYDSNKQFLSVNELKVAIVKEWYNSDDATDSVFNHLDISIKNRVFEVIREKDKIIIVLIYALFLYLDKCIF